MDHPGTVHNREGGGGEGEAKADEMEERSAPGLVDSGYKMAAGKIPARGSHPRHLQLISDPLGFTPRAVTVMPSVGQS